jgi:hypothetical protein
VYGLKKKNSAWLLLSSFLIASAPSVSAASAPSFEQRLNTFLGKLSQPIQTSSNSNTALIADANFQYQGCKHYPYHNTANALASHQVLTLDIKQGLEKGLSCLAGKSPAGQLHPYHEYQALKLMKLLESEKTKTVHCVEDEIFAYAIANTPINPHRKPHPQDKLTAGLPYPGILIDTFRLSGSISNKHDEATYRDFYKLDDEQIKVIKTGKPLKLEGMHRYKKRDGLMFHEMIHWLGHEHSSIYPDTTHLYETCCFGGSDFISDETKNKKFQKQACNILKDDELWGKSKYQQMRLWKYKEYDQLKRNMRGLSD